MDYEENNGCESSMNTHRGREGNELADRAAKTKWSTHS